MSFQTLKATVEHESSTHMEGGKYKCHQCNCYFETRLGFINHCAAHKGQQLHKCTTCDRAYYSLSNLIRHNRTVHGENKKLPCTKCEKTFKHKDSLKEHMQCHNGIKVKCSICHKFVRCKKTLIRHMRTHKPKEERRVKCGICEKSLISEQGLRHHMKHIHTDGNTYRYQCDICKQTFNYRENMRRHIRTVHENKHWIQCPKCATTVSKDMLKQHLKTHEDVRTKHQCEICHQTYTTKFRLRDHKRVHNPGGNKDFECTTCGKKLTTKHTLRNHLLTHSEQRNYKCVKCGMAFKPVHLFFICWGKFCRSPNCWRIFCCSPHLMGNNLLRAHI